jgi:D-alanyl-D-alanine carboxypeptidase
MKLVNLLLFSSVKTLLQSVILRGCIVVAGVVVLIGCSSGGSSVNNPTNVPQIQAMLESTANYYLNVESNASYKPSGLQLNANCPNQPPIAWVQGTFGHTQAQLVTQNSIFELGSITKSFTSVVILQLSAEKNFSLDSSLASVAPLTAARYPQWSVITIRQLLNMTSGIPDYSATQAFMNDAFTNPTTYMPFSQVLGYVESLPLKFTPSSNYDYSNTNYTLLAEVVLEVSGHSFESEINSRIINKLHLTNLFYPPDKPSAVVSSAQLVYGYAGGGWAPYAGTEILPNYSLSYANAGGAMISNANDLNSYIHALFTANGLLNASQLSALISPISMNNGQPLNYPLMPGQRAFGLGVMMMNLSHVFSNLPLVYLYSGETFGFLAIYVYDANTGTSISMTINSSSQKININLLASDLNNLINLCAN